MGKARLRLSVFRACMGACSALTIVLLMALEEDPLHMPWNIAFTAIAVLSLAMGIARPSSPAESHYARFAKDGRLKLADFGLSAREHELILLFIRGATMKQIAIEKGLSHSTVRNTFSSAYAKLGVQGSSELTVLGALYKVE